MRHIDLDIDNQTLVEECRSGDRDAMSILYTRFAPRMLHVISRYVSDRDSAQDILHDGFIAAFTRLDSVRDPERLDFWLATIMKNLSLKYLQAQTVTSILDEIPENIEEPELDDILDFATLESLIRKLPEGYQKVFRLAVLENKSHNEISQILGIAPNSSSSQLFHAKLRLRELIKDYQLRAGLISLLLLLVSVSILFLFRQDNLMPTSDHLSADSMQNKRLSNDDTQSEPVHENSLEEKIVSTYTSDPGKPIIVEETHSENVSVDPPLPTESETQSTFSSDSVGISSPSSIPESYKRKPLHDEHDNFYDRIFADLPQKACKDKGWSAGISFASGILSFNSINGTDLSDMASNPSTNPKPDDEDVPSQAKIPRLTNEIESLLGSVQRRHHLPISFALTAEKHFSSWLGLESGIGYSYLHTDFECLKEPSTCHWHYLEIPLQVNLYAYTSPRIKLYFGFGGRVAIPVYSYAQIAPNYLVQSGRFDSKPVWSAGGSVGISFRISKRVDLFVEPSLRYHFPQECTIPNIWTDDEPWSLSIPIGFRFNW
ncbi:MAG: sigma-70 family RNA polymerase sigma factor [Muribaculaceae bacterium]|nr:sigma-70 family RNA polymerase sigma factor [Muribaculaceae bacterium]